MGAIISIYGAQQISIQYRGGDMGKHQLCFKRTRWEIAAHSLQQFHSSELLILSPSFSWALDALQVLVALVYTPPGCMVKGHRHQTSDSNVWRITQGNKPADGCFLLNTDNRHVYLSPLPSPGLEMLTLASSWSSAKRKRRGLIKTNTTDVTQMKNDFKCTLYIHSHIRGESQ